ncbi:P-loop containing nucleoside triphosphate hydrolase [Sesbania bispinosa]|nr:P-loop containing nucleoside triphosphate hydrolase [Sesbania bispinosa]
MLLNLKYLNLNLRNTKIKVILKFIGNLRNIETLNLRHTQVRELPKEINRLVKLRHLLSFSYDFNKWYGVKLNEGIKCLTTLQSLTKIDLTDGNDVIKELKILKRMRRLGIIMRKVNGNEVCTTIKNMCHLCSLSIATTGDELDQVLELQSLIDPPPCIQRLYLDGRLDNLPRWIPKLKNLVSLQLMWSRLVEYPLPLLKYLSELGEHLLKTILESFYEEDKNKSAVKEISEMEFWVDVEHALPTDDNNGKIILTTRDRKVADFCKSCAPIFIDEMKPLPFEDGLKLFHMKAFQFDPQAKGFIKEDEINKDQITEEVTEEYLVENEEFRFHGLTRRLSIHKNIENVEDERAYGSVRSCFFSDLEELPKSTVKLKSLLSSFKLLEALDFENSPLDYLPEPVRMLLNLKYLNLRNTEIKVIPKFIGIIQNIETLNLRDTQKILKRIRRLGIIMRKVNGNEVCTTIKNMCHLCSLSIATTGDESGQVLELQSLIDPPPCIQRLYLDGRLDNLPRWTPKLKNLVSLRLMWSRLVEDPLPLLKSLSELGEHLLKTILESFYEEDKNKSAVKEISEMVMSMDNLIRKIREYLQAKSYVIVSDDIWEQEFWADVEHSPTDDNNGKIILTTRDRRVADFCKSCAPIFIHEMKPLPFEDGLKLFHMKAFQFDQQGCPDELMKLSKHFAENFEGVPLAIVAISGLLSTKNKIVSDWKTVKIYDWYFDGSVRSCGVHDLMHAFITRMCEELNICQAVENEEFRFHELTRHLSTHKNIESVADKRAYGSVRSCFFSDLEELPKSTVKLKSLLSNFKLLEALDFENSPLDYLPEPVRMLLNLKYLNLRNTKIKVIPKFIGIIQNIETLNLRDTQVRELPKEVNRLVKLRHLLSFSYDFNKWYVVKLNEGIECLTTLQSLRKIDLTDGNGVIKELKILKRMRRLGIIMRKVNGNEVCTTIKNMCHLCSLSIATTGDESGQVLELQSLIDPPPCIQRLYLDGRLDNLPRWTPKLKNLVSLRLMWSRLVEDPLPLLKSLSELVDLYLYTTSKRRKNVLIVMLGSLCLTHLRESTY